MRILTYTLFLYLSLHAGAQKLPGGFSTSAIHSAFTDPEGNFILIKKDGGIEKFDKDGKMLYSNKLAEVPTLFDINRGSNMLAFNYKRREYIRLNSFLEQTEKKPVDSAWAIDPVLVCATGNYDLWLLDAYDQTLKKIDTRSNAVSFEFPIHIENWVEEEREFIYICEYQHFIFLQEARTGIHIFNSIGKHLQTIPMPAPLPFRFMGEDLYFKQHSNLIFVNLFDLRQASQKIESGAKQVLLTDQRRYDIFDDRVEIVDFKP